MLFNTKQHKGTHATVSARSAQPAQHNQPTLNPQPSAISPQPSALNLQPSALSPQPSTFSSQR